MSVLIFIIGQNGGAILNYAVVKCLVSAAQCTLHALSRLAVIPDTQTITRESRLLMPLLLICVSRST